MGKSLYRRIECKKNILDFDDKLKQRAKAEKFINENEALLVNIGNEERKIANALELIGEVIDTAKEIDSLQNQIVVSEKIDISKKDYDKAVTELGRHISVDQKDLENCQLLSNKIEALQMAGDTQGIKIEVNPLGEINPQVIIDGDEISWEKGMPINGRAKIDIIFPGIAELKIENKNPGAAENLKKEKNLRKDLTTALEKYSCTVIEEMTKLKEDRDSAEDMKEKAEVALTTLLGEKTYEQYKEELLKLKNDLTLLQDNQKSKIPLALAAVNEVDDSEPGEDIIAFFKTKKISLESKTSTLQTDYAEPNRIFHENKGLLKILPSHEELEAGKKHWGLRLFAAETTRKDTYLPGISLEKIVELEKEIELISENLNENIDKKKRLELVLSTAKYGIEDVEDLEGQIEVLEKNLKDLKNNERILQLICELYKEARKITLTKITDSIGEKMAEYARALTRNHYTRVGLDPGTLDLQVHSDEKGGLVDIDSELSTGARDQIYLAARLAMIPYVANGRKPPIFIDDSIVFFDTNRRQKALEIIKNLSVEHQVFIFSCQDYYESVADNIICL